MEDSNEIATLEARIAYLEKKIEFLDKGEKMAYGRHKNVMRMLDGLNGDYNRLRTFYYNDFPDRAPPTVSFREYWTMTPEERLEFEARSLTAEVKTDK